jgi:hypothetical protein
MFTQHGFVAQQGAMSAAPVAHQLIMLSFKLPNAQIDIWPSAAVIVFTLIASTAPNNSTRENRTSSAETQACVLTGLMAARMIFSRTTIGGWKNGLHE